MTERYLFKAKRTDNGEWVQGALFDGESHCIIGQEIKFSPYIEHECKIAGYEVDRNTICQCTGLKDNNGKLIWENDIIHKPFYRDYDAYVCSKAYTGRIQYENGGWSVEITESDGSVCVSPIIEMIAYSKDIEHFEVIGNIFDNADLLEK